MNEISTYNIALLIDGDNTQPDLLTNIIAEAGRYGKVTIRRIYGDWTISNMKGWKDQINKHAIRPMQQFAYTKGKNSTDSAMIIDAMDILHKKLVNGFCLVSSDSDYAGIANRIREEGVFVMGIGRANTPDAFQKACEIFIYTENLKPDELPVKKSKLKRTVNLIHKKADEVKVSKESEIKNADSKIEKKNSGKVAARTVGEIKSKITKKPLDISVIDKAFEMAVQDDETAHLSGIGIQLRRLDPSFDTRTYGFYSLTGLFKSLPQKYEIVYKSPGTPPLIKLKK